MKESAPTIHLTQQTAREEKDSLMRCPFRHYASDKASRGGGRVSRVHEEKERCCERRNFLSLADRNQCRKSTAVLREQLGTLLWSLDAYRERERAISHQPSGISILPVSHILSHVLQICKNLWRFLACFSEIGARLRSTWHREEILKWVNC